MKRELRDDIRLEPGLECGDQMLDERAEDDLHLHLRKSLTEADARTRGEGHIGAARERAFVLTRPALRLERKGIGMDTRVATERELADEDRLVFREAVAFDDDVFGWAPRIGPHRRHQAERLLDHLMEVGEVVEIVELDGTIPDLLLDLRVELFGDMRIFREEIPGPRHGVRGRLMASKKERHRLIAELLIRHALT